MFQSQAFYFLPFLLPVRGCSHVCHHLGQSMASVDTASDENESLSHEQDEYGIQPYQYEPSTSESSDSREEDNDETSLQDTAWYSVMHAYYGT